MPHIIHTIYYVHIICHINIVLLLYHVCCSYVCVLCISMYWYVLCVLSVMYVCAYNVYRACIICALCVSMHVYAHMQPALTTPFLCRGLLGRPGWRDSELLRQCRGSEQWLWGLPCSWVQVPAHAWGHAEELAKVVRGRILQEQARLVWVERGSSRGGSGSSSEA